MAPPQVEPSRPSCKAEASYPAAGGRTRRRAGWTRHKVHWVPRTCTPQASAHQGSRARTGSLLGTRSPQFRSGSTARLHPRTRRIRPEGQARSPSARRIAPEMSRVTSRSGPLIAQNPGGAPSREGTEGGSTSKSTVSCRFVALLHGGSARAAPGGRPHLRGDLGRVRLGGLRDRRRLARDRQLARIELASERSGPGRTRAGSPCQFRAATEVANGVSGEPGAVHPGENDPMSPPRDPPAPSWNLTSLDGRCPPGRLETSLSRTARPHGRSRQ
jgi:hypothetical protein